ncbi:hypothetical protein BD309DRAFT_223191 [Dichomitus squalens]|nr:hypothetical protein BD309DRAFT_223191 [Dichomitus squalens]
MIRPSPSSRSQYVPVFHRRRICMRVHIRVIYTVRLFTSVLPTTQSLSHRSLKLHIMYIPCNISESEDIGRLLNAANTVFTLFIPCSHAPATGCVRLPASQNDYTSDTNIGGTEDAPRRRTCVQERGAEQDLLPSIAKDRFLKAWDQRNRVGN